MLDICKTCWVLLHPDGQGCSSIKDTVAPWLYRGALARFSSGCFRPSVDSRGAG